MKSHFIVDFKGEMIVPLEIWTMLIGGGLVILLSFLSKQK